MKSVTPFFCTGTAAIRDPRVLRLIRLWFVVGVMHEGVLEETVVGSPHPRRTNFLTIRPDAFPAR